MSTKTNVDNMGGSTSDPSPRLLHWGLDRVEYTVSCDASAIRRITNGAVAACKKGECRADRVETPYRLAVRFPDMSVSIPSENAVHTGLKVRCYAGYCISRPAKEIDGDVLAMLARLSGASQDMFTLRLSRLDVAYDIAGLRPTLDLKQVVSCAYDRHHYESRYGDGLVIGRSTLMLRVYDKSAEARKANMLAVWEDIWGVAGEQVWRIEYQLRKRHLHGRCIATVNMFLARLKDETRYLQAWTRMEHTQVRKDQPRRPVGWWQDAMVLLPLSAEFLPESYNRPIRIAPNPQRLRASLLGMIASLTASIQETGTSGSNPSYDHQWVKHLMDELIEQGQPTLRQKHESKCRELRMQSLE